jgi:hypothetical protein
MPITTDDCLSFSISDLNKYWNFKRYGIINGQTRWLTNGEERASICYTINLIPIKGQPYIEFNYSKNKEPLKYKVYLTTTQPHYGGKRWWFICPSTGERCGVLFLAPSQTRFYSRKAFNHLPYTSQNEPYWDRALRRKDTLMKQYGIKGNDLHFDRPKGMHKSTYNKHIQRLEALDDYINEIVQSFMKRL